MNYCNHHSLRAAHVQLVMYLSGLCRDIGSAPEAVARLSALAVGSVVITSTAPAADVAAGTDKKVESKRGSEAKPVDIAPQKLASAPLTAIEKNRKRKLLRKKAKKNKSAAQKVKTERQESKSRSGSATDDDRVRRFGLFFCDQFPELRRRAEGYDEAGENIATRAVKERSALGPKYRKGSVCAHYFFCSYFEFVFLCCLQDLQAAYAPRALPRDPTRGVANEAVGGAVRRHVSP